jgi:hypothetical protein
MQIDADFLLKDYGPFSREIAQATEFLTLTGDVEEEVEKFGSVLMSVDKVRSDRDVNLPDERWIEVLRRLSKYSTIELEVAATIEFFRAQGSSAEEAQDLTKEMKPTKAVPSVLAKSSNILEELYP